MAAKAIFDVVGRYMNGTEVVGYQLQNMDTHEQKMYTRDQVYFLAGKGVLRNCSGRLYQDKVILEGVGISLTELPALNINKGVIRNSEGIGKIRRGTSSEDAMSQVICVGKRSNGDFVLKNPAGGLMSVNKFTLFSMAQSGKVGNMRAQNYHNKQTDRVSHIVRLIDGRPLSSLPIMD